jgi:cyclase
MRRAVLAATLVAGLIVRAPHALAQAPTEPAPDAELQVLKVQGNVWMIAGAGGNIAVQAGEQGVVVVDTGSADLSEKVLAAIRGISTRPIRYVINTSAAPQHIGGNATLGTPKSGAMPNIIAQENVYTRMTRLGPDGKSAFPADAWPTDGYYAPERKLIFNGEAIEILHMPNAYSDGDSIVHFRGSNVLVTGDIFTTTNLPMVNRAQGGTYTGILTALRKLLDIAAADDLMEGGTYIIPGHGRICDDADLVEYHDMAYEIADRVKKLVAQRKTVADIKTARPVLGWEGRYSQPGWTTEMFLDAIYPDFAPRTPASTPPRQRIQKK